MVLPSSNTSTATPPITFTRRSSARTKNNAPCDHNTLTPLVIPPASTNAPDGASHKRPQRRLSNRKRKVTPVLENSSSLDQQLFDKSVHCIQSLSHQAANAQAAVESLFWIDSHPKARNVLMSVSPMRDPAHTTDQVTQAHVGPHTQDGFLPQRTLNHANASLLNFVPILAAPHKSPTTSIPRLSRARSLRCAKDVSAFTWQNYPNMQAACQPLVHGPQAGKPKVHVSFPELHRRMLLADQAFPAEKRKDSSSNRPNSNHAKAWQSVDNAMLDKRQILHSASVVITRNKNCCLSSPWQK
jgi:hypothetical protein